jgi:hypothetical protein
MLKKWADVPHASRNCRLMCSRLDTMFRVGHAHHLVFIMTSTVHGCLLGSAKLIKGLAAILSLLLAALAEHYAEQLWVVTMPSGNREFYHSPVSHLSLVIVFFAVAIVVYKLGVRILTHSRTGR